MKHITSLFYIFFTVALLSSGNLAEAAGRGPSSDGKWIASGGFGLTISPTLVLINPQLEYQHDSRLTFGPMVQAGLGDVSLVTMTGTVRYVIGDHPKLKPSVEGGLGLAVGSSSFASSVGVHILMGMGAEWVIDSNLSIGSMVRANLAPPLKTFFLSWPLVLARFHL